MFRHFALATIYVLLIACAAPAPMIPQSAVAPDPEPEPVEPVERSIPDDSLYPLLVAEFALRRRAYDVALQKYLEQAPLLRDAGISSHSTRLAQFMQRDPEALASAQLWVELDPDNTEAYNTLATLLMRQGRPTEAVPHLARVARHGAQANFPGLLIGFTGLDEAQQAQLVAAINELGDEFPRDTQLLLAQALAHAELKQYEPALARLKRLFNLEPLQPQAVVLETRILLNMQDERPFARMQKALEANPGNKRLRLQYARLLTASDMPAARKQFEILSAQSPRDGDLLLSLALINRESGDNLEAKAYLRQLLALEQRLDEANYYLGRIAEDGADLREALGHYKLVESGQEFLSANNRIGGILLQLDRAEELGAWFSQQREKFPLRREQLYGMEADILARAGFPDAAMQVLNQALAELPESGSLLYARSMLGEQLNDLVLMESDLRAIIARDPENATALNALGYTLANLTDRYKEAFDLISQALQLQPDEPAILDSMGWVLFRQGRLEEAMDYLTRAYAAFPDSEVAAHLGEVMWVSGDTDGATSLWLNALRKEPDSKILLDTVQRLGAAVPEIESRKASP